MKPETQRKTTPRTKAAVAKETPAVKLEVLTPKPATVKPKKEAAKPKYTPTHEEIAKRAYEIYAGRGKTTGNEVEDWAQAERELVLAATSRNN